MLRLENSPPPVSSEDWCVVFAGRSLVSDPRAAEPCLISRRTVRLMGWEPQREQFLGFWKDQPCYAVQIDRGVEIDPVTYTTGHLMQILGRVDDALFAVAGRASQLLTWRKEHSFCGACATPMEFNAGENAMHCASCDSNVYPRINPAIITLVHRGEEVLLGRGPKFPPGMFSTLAGFVEAGESAEQTLRREVAEEVGVQVSNIEYFGSQSWPFPSQLMLGFFAQYTSGDVVCHDEEIVEAQWFHWSDLPRVPPRQSISGALIADWRERVQSN